MTRKELSNEEPSLQYCAQDDTFAASMSVKDLEALKCIAISAQLVEGLPQLSIFSAHILHTHVLAQIWHLLDAVHLGLDKSP